MATKVFLSLSFVDRDFVRETKDRLPTGLAHFYESSFANGEALLDAMERTIKDSSIFVLFVSKASANSPWVGFEIDHARLEKIQRPNFRLLVFPVDRNASHQDLPQWLRQYWIPRAGFSPSDIARYITGVLLEPNVGLSPGAVRVIGRGKSLDKLEQLVADQMARKRRAPNVYFLSGFRGIGRRTFASYYMRTALSPEESLPYGPTLTLPSQADLTDVYLALRTQISPTMNGEDLTKENKAFLELDLKQQVAEIVRSLSYFGELHQAIVLSSSGGFFEDRGEPKEWVLPLLSSIPDTITLFVISNRQLPPQSIETVENIVQMRVEELTDRDIRALMIFTAERLRVENFSISNELVHSIGGHADVANAAVRLASIKGTHILERQPHELSNIQNLILGDSIADDALTDVQKDILGLLSWVPSLSGTLIERIITKHRPDSVDAIMEIEDLVLGCIVIANGSSYSMSPAIRFPFRRFNVTPPSLLNMFATELNAEWDDAREKGEFRMDLFEAFVFMNSLEGLPIPNELAPLLPSGMLSDVIKETYARGKDEADSEALNRVIQWGRVANHMKMSEATREDIFSTVARAQIRLGKFSDADKTIDYMATRGHRSVPFLRGHSYRRQERYDKAIEMLVQAVASEKFNRSAVHELALAYKKYGRFNELRKLLSEHGSLIRDSAMFADFQIGIDLARGDIIAAEQGITNLRRLPDDDGRSDIREAQLLIRKQQYRLAKNALSKLLRGNQRHSLRIRSIRAICAARDGDFSLSRDDIDFVKSFPSWQAAATRLEASLLVEQKKPAEARALLDKLSTQSAEDLLLYARALDVEADLPITHLNERQGLREQASELRERNKFALEYDFGEH